MVPQAAALLSLAQVYENCGPMVLGKLKSVLRSMGSILGYFFKDVRRNAVYVYSSAVRWHCFPLRMGATKPLSQFLCLCCFLSFSVLRLGTHAALTLMGTGFGLAPKFAPAHHDPPSAGCARNPACWRVFYD